MFGFINFIFYIQVQHASLITIDNTGSSQYVVQLRYVEEFQLIQNLAPLKVHKSQARSFYVFANKGDVIMTGTQVFKILFNEEDPKKISFSMFIYFKAYFLRNFQFIFKLDSYFQTFLRALFFKKKSAFYFVYIFLSHILNYFCNLFCFAFVYLYSVYLTFIYIVYDQECGFCIKDKVNQVYRLVAEIYKNSFHPSQPTTVATNTITDVKSEEVSLEPKKRKLHTIFDVPKKL